MRKHTLLAAAAVLTLVSAPAFAMNLAEGEDGGGPGCGVGTMYVFKGQKGILPQILATTTNGTFSNSFAITTGTSGCHPDGVVLNEYERRIFAAANFRNLKQDVARGHGEYLNSLASLMGVQGGDQVAFGALAQANFAALTGEGAAAPDTFLAALDTALATDPQLSRYAR
ncbi:MAG: DUF3015 domain-containing protein [Nitrospirota bacterium]|nr:DUF3015 domain-containing protein [Nitrospirota bacterium]